MKFKVTLLMNTLKTAKIKTAKLLRQLSHIWNRRQNTKNNYSQDLSPIRIR